MGEWANPSGWASVFLVVATWVLYRVLRPLRDYYVLQRSYFVRLSEPPWRGEHVGTHYHAFTDYLAAKALFDRSEVEYMEMLDHGRQEAEHSLFMISTRSKPAAIARVKEAKLSGKELLHRTPFGDIHNRRMYWQKTAKEAAAYICEQAEAAQAIQTPVKAHDEQ